MTEFASALTSGALVLIFTLGLVARTRGSRRAVTRPVVVRVGGVA